MKGLLFIDDEEGIRRSLVRALKHESYNTYTAENGESGIRFIDNRFAEIDFVISDYKMPGIDGLEALAVIGKMSPDITRVILTGYATVEAAIKATNEGIDGFLTKPFDNREIRAKIHEITVRKRLKQFVSEPVFHELTDSVAALRPRFHEVTILFSDIRDFTRMTCGAEPQVIAEFLNNLYFTPMGEIICRHNGTMDKHIGDSIMAVFGAPISHPDDPLQAVKTAVAIQEKAGQINEGLSNNCLRLNIGIGISTGMVFSGVLGSIRKKEFSSIGMAVNVASRLQDLAKAGEILISKNTLDKVAEKIKYEAAAPVIIKGTEEPVSIYKVTEIL